MAPPRVDNDYRNQIESARKQLVQIISDKKKDYAPLMIRLALHDAGIYGFETAINEYYLIKGGPNGSIRTPKEYNHPSNNGLEEAVKLCDGVKKDKSKITYADLYQLAGVAAVQITGGPKIEFVPGREDSTVYPDLGQLQPNKLDESTLENIRKRMGLEDKYMVALFGVLHQLSLPYKSSADNEPEFKFDNSYFRKLLEKKDQSNLLYTDARFRKWVETYAEDNDTFCEDYAAAHKKVSELGMSVAGKQTDQKTPAPGMSVEGKQAEQKTPAPSRNRARLVQGIGIAVVTTAIILGFFWSRRSK